jgi:adenylyl- and sulfurtransferase ThiI
MKDKPIPSTIKFSPELQEKIAEAARITGLPKQEIIRLCTAIGIEDLRRINYDIAGAIVDKAKPIKQDPVSYLKVAEDETPYRVGNKANGEVASNG